MKTLLAYTAGPVGSAWDNGQGRLDVGRPHVHRDGLHSFQLSRRETSPEFGHTLGLSILRNVLHSAMVQVCHDRHVGMSFAESLLVHTDVGDHGHLLATLTPSHRSARHPPDFVPAHAQDPSGTWTVAHRCSTSITNRSIMSVKRDLASAQAVRT